MDYYIIGYMLLFIGAIVTIVADVYLQTRYKKYKQQKNSNGLSGFEVARQILDANGLDNIYVVETKGMLSDHYDPNGKVVRLSHDIFHGETIAATSVAAHEVGHAIQDKEGYKPMRLRSFIVPFASFGSRFGYIAIVIGLLFQSMNIAWVGMGLLLLILLFQLVTLPVEFNASARAEQEIKRLKLLAPAEQSDSKKMLTAAALTYVASLVTTITELLRLLLLILANNNDN